jgi:hypothetical protein
MLSYTQKGRLGERLSVGNAYDLRLLDPSWWRRNENCRFSRFWETRHGQPVQIGHALVIPDVQHDEGRELILSLPGVDVFVREPKLRAERAVPRDELPFCQRPARQRVPREPVT